MATEIKRYCVLIQLRPGSDIKRVARDVPEIVTLLQRLSSKEMEQLCRSSDGTLFGFFIKSKLPPNMIRAEFEKSQSTGAGDSFIIFEVGQDFNGIGFSRAWTWLQHH